MLNKAVKTIGAIFGILVPVFLAYLLSRTVPDVKYTLSEKIPVSFLSTSPSEIVQQLEVKNIGSAEAKRVVVRIRGQITSYQLQKYSSADAAQVFDNQQPFEVDYPQLPPQAGFKLVFKSSGNGVEYRDLTISHDAGAAQEALSTAPKGLLDTLVPWLLVGVIGGYLFYGARELRKIEVSMWKTNARSSDLKHMLQLKQPWYVWDKEWHLTRVEVIKGKVQDPGYVRVEIHRTAAYQALNIDEPDQLEKAEWDENTELAVKVLETTYASAIKSAYITTDLVDLLRIQRPRHFPTDKWGDLQKQANERFFELKMRSVYTLEKLRQALTESKPDSISDISWAEYVIALQSRYYDALAHDLAMSDVPTDFTSKADLNLLDEKHKKRLEDLATRFEDTRRQTDRYSKLLELLKCVLYQKSIEENRPDQIDDLDWLQLNHVKESMEKLRDVESMSERNRVEATRLVQETAVVSNLRQKLERQLSIINDVLNDSAAIDRIESYDDTFAPGNFENLRKVARLLGDARKKGTRPTA